MANKPISIEFVADVAKYLRETKKMEVSTEDIADALVATTHSADDLERKLSKAMRDSAKDTEVLERALKDLPKASEDAGRKMADDIDDAGDKIGETGREMGANLAGNLGEGLSSGDLSDTIQDTLGEAVSSGAGGPVLAAVAGLALIIWNTFKAESEKHKQAVSDQFNLVDIVTGELDRMAQLEQAWTDFGGTQEEGIAKAKKDARLLNISMTDLSKLLTGEINPATNQTKQNVEDQLAAAGDLYGQNKITSEQYWEIRNAAKELLGHVEDQRDVWKESQGLIASTRTVVQETGNAMDPMVVKSQQILENFQNIPDNLRVNLEFYATGPGAEYITYGEGGRGTPGVSYSPGHVAIANSYVRRAKGAAY